MGGRVSVCSAAKIDDLQFLNVIRESASLLSASLPLQIRLPPARREKTSQTEKKLKDEPFSSLESATDVQNSGGYRTYPVSDGYLFTIIRQDASW